MSQATYVKIADIKAAVKGREGEILDALSIDWQAGRPHIRCPYPEHADSDPSWRWDERAARARCTCSKSDSVFNVVMKIEGVDFEAAKLRVAEIIGRDDLVKEKVPKGKSFQKTDAESLLNPPIQDRGDALPVAYLAYRLGVEPEAVPMPTTPVAGWKRLAYFDPPPASKGRGRPPKPDHVGDFPCAIFGTVDADGKRHAHRIYVAPEGAGKAELGEGANGYPRDPKKSAKVTDGDKISGRSVLWGDPAQAPSILLCEGIETGAALAYAFHADIEKEQVAIAAAISANGVEAFHPWPATKTVVICADRDEAPKPNGKPGSRRGEKAARIFAFKHCKKISTLIGLPGDSSESVDWLDVLDQSGAQAVREGVTDAQPFEPTDTEMQAEQQRLTIEAEIDRISRLYPLPRTTGIGLDYLPTSTGEIKAHKLVIKGEEREWHPIATPFTIAARLHLADHDGEYGLRMIIQDMDGEPRTIDFERSTLAKMNGTEIRSMLLAAGLRIDGDGDQVIVRCLKSYRPDHRITALRAPGWHHQPNIPGDFFICPDGEIVGAPEGVSVELTTDVRLSGHVARGGTIEGWKDAAAAAVQAENVPHFTLALQLHF